MVEPERDDLLPTKQEENSGNGETIVELKQLKEAVAGYHSTRQGHH